MRRLDAFSLYLLIAITFPMALFSGCQQKTPPDTGTNTEQVQPDSPDFIDGVPANKFYQALAYRKEDVGQAPYRYLSSDWLWFDTAYEGDIYVQFSLFLMPNHEFDLLYQEAVGSLDADGLFKPIRTLFRKLYRGQTELIKTDLRIGDIAVASGVRKNGRAAVYINFLRNLHDDGMEGFSQVLRYGYFEDGLGGKLTADLIESDEAKWLEGTWKHEGESLSVKRDPTELRIEYLRDVGKRFDSEVPQGTICHYYVLATDVDLGLDPYGSSYKYTLSYRPDRVDLIQDDKNSPNCANFIEREHRRVANRPTDELSFRHPDDQTILTTTGEVFQRQ